MIRHVGELSQVPKDLWERNPVFHEPSDSIWPHVALYLIQIIGLWLPPFRGRRELTVSLICVLAIHTQLRPHFTNDPGTAQPFTISWSYYLATVEKLLFSTDGVPEKDFWRVDRRPQEALAMTGLGVSKLRWAAMLILNQRGVRWNFQVKNIPGVSTKEGPRSDRKERVAKNSFATSRLGHCSVQLYHFAWNLFCADLTFQLSARVLFTPALPPPSSAAAAVILPPGNINSKYLTIRHPNPLWQLAKGLIFGSAPYFMVSAQYSALSIVAVALGLSQPADWPPVFGRLSQASTVRAFWGQFWHQQLRRMLSQYAQRFVDALGVARGTNASSYLQLWLAFLLSGVFHALSQLNMPRPVNISGREVCVGFFVFFVCQAAAITFEDFVIWTAKKASWSRWSTGTAVKEHGKDSAAAGKLVGHVWVTMVLWYSLPFAADTFLRMRMGAEGSMLPFSVSQSWVEKYVPVPPLVLSI